MLLGAQGVKLPLLFRAVGIKIRGFGGISDEAIAEARSPLASFLSGVPGFFLRLKKEMGYIRSPYAVRHSRPFCHETENEHRSPKKL